jgi:hypothetical protein
MTGYKEEPFMKTRASKWAPLGWPPRSVAAVARVIRLAARRSAPTLAPQTAIFICGGELEKVMAHSYENGLKGHKKIAQGTAGEKQEPKATADRDALGYSPSPTSWAGGHFHPRWFHENAVC